MSVKLCFTSPDPGFPLGFTSTYATFDEALAQAVADVRSTRSAQPMRIESQDGGKVLADRAAIEKAAK